MAKLTDYFEKKHKTLSQINAIPDTMSQAETGIETLMDADSGILAIIAEKSRLEEQTSLSGRTQNAYMAARKNLFNPLGEFLKN